MRNRYVARIMMVLAVLSGLHSFVLAQCPNPAIVIQGSNATSATYCQNSSGGTLKLNQPAANQITSYQWLLAGSNISGATNSTFQIPTSSTGTRQYCVRITDTCGNTRISNEIPITINAPPSTNIVVQGSNATSATYCKDSQGGSLVVANPASNTIVSYQWLLAGQNISGATTSTFSIPTSTVGTKYYCVRITNNSGCVTTSNEIPVTITNPPTPTTFIAGNEAGTIRGLDWCVGNLPTEPANILPPCVGTQNTYSTYQWKLNGQDVAGATNRLYAIPWGSLQAGTYVYNVSVTQNGCAATSTDGITFTVRNPVTPSIAVQNNGATTYCQNATGGTLVVTQPTTGITAYQWLLAGQNISGATSSTFQIPTSQVGTRLYCVRITDACGSRVSNEISITVNTAPTVVIAVQNNGATTYCQNATGGTLVVTQPTTGITAYQWLLAGQNISGATSSTFQIPTSQVGTRLYCVRITDACGSRVSNEISITVNTAPTVVITVQNNGATTYCQNATGGTLVVTQPTTGITAYQWLLAGQNISGATSSTFQIPTSQVGTRLYCVRITDACGSRVSNEISITVNTAPTVVIAVQNNGATTYCQNATGGTLVVTQPTTGITAYQWLLAGQNISGATSSTFQIPTSQVGTRLYCVRITDACGSRVSNEISITVNTAPTVVITVQNNGATTYCQNATGGTLVVTQPTTGITAYQWLLAGQNISGATSSTFQIPTSQVGTRLYCVRITDACGSRVSNEISITVVANPAPTTYFNGDNAATIRSLSWCVGQLPSQPTNILPPCVGTQTYSSYQWRLNGQNIAGATNRFYALPWTTMQPGTYIYTVSVVQNGCTGISNDNITVTVNSKPDVSITIQGQTGLTKSWCFGQSSATLNASTNLSGSAWTYQWQLNSSNISGATSSTYNVGSTTAVGNYSYRVIAKNESNCFDTSEVATITVNALPTPTTSIVGDNGTMRTFNWCFGQLPTQPAAIIPPCIQTEAYASYQWQLNGSDIAGATNRIYALPWGSYQPGTYSFKVRVTNANGCTTISTDDLTFTVYAKPQVTATIQGQSGTSKSWCYGLGSATLNATTGFSSYQWQLNGTNIAGATSSTFTIGNTTATGTYTYRVLVGNSNGCRDTSGNLTITVNAQPSVTISSSGPNTFITGGSPTPTLSGVVTPTGISGLAYQWLVNGSAVSGATNATYAVPSTMTAGTYSYKLAVRTPLGCVDTSSAIVITVTGQPTVTVSVTSGTAEYCFGLQSPTLGSSVTGSGGNTITYQWYRDNTAISGATNASYSVPMSTVAGTYVYRVSASMGGVTVQSNNQTVVVNPKPSATVSSTVNEYCVGTTPSTLSTQTFTSYQWQLNGSNIAGATSSSYTMPTTTTSGVYQYRVIVTNDKGCKDTSSAKTITVNALPIPTTYFNGDNGGTIRSLSWCVGTLPTQPAAILPPCVGTQSYASYQWQLNGSDIAGATNMLYALPWGSYQPGTYVFKVRVTNDKGCTSLSADSMVVTVYGVPEAVATIQGQSGASVSWCYGKGSAALTSQTGFNSYQWQVNGTNIAGATTSSYTVASSTASGSYQYRVIVTNGNNCLDTSNILSVTVNAQPSVTISSSGPNTFITGGSPTPTLSGVVTPTGISGLAYQWLVNGSAVSGATNATYAVPSTMTAGTYSYKLAVRTPSGCVDTSTFIQVTVADLPTIVQNINPNPAQKDSTYFNGITPPVLNSTISNTNGGPITYQWVNASTGLPIPGATSATYTVPSQVPGNYVYYVTASTGGVTIRAVDTLRITVLAPPSISNRINPNKLDSTYFQGVPAPTLVSTLTGDQGRPVSYQWIDASTGSAVAGATTSSYQVPNSLAPGTYTYYVSATVGGLGIRAVDTLRITVLAPPSISNRINPNKLDSTYFQGVPAPTLVSTLTGDQGRPVSYQWIDASTGSAVAGATTSSYQVPNSLAPGTYTYYVSATVGGLGIRAVDTLRITVLAPPSISNRINPNKLDSTYFQGVPAPTLVSTLTGDQGRPVSYQWIDASTGSAVAGATTSSYQVPNSLAPGTYTYYVSATVGGLGIRAVDTLRITVLAPPSISNRINPNKLDSTYFQGVPAPTLVSTLTGDQGRPVSYQWIDASTGSAVAGATTSSYQVPNSLAPGTYTYYVSATVGGLGIRAVDTLRITVLAPPSISNRINPNKLDSTYFQGVPAPTLVSTLTGDQGRPVSYQWIDASTGSAVAGATTSSYQVPNSLAPGTYTYYVSATVGGLGIRAVDTLRITVLAPPSISNRINPNKLDSTYFQGVPAPTLVSTLTGDQGRPVSYQWIDASTGSAVAGATTSSYQVPNSLAPGTYTYYVSATVGGLGIRAVDTLRITVLAPPSISNRINPNKLDSTYFQGVPAPTLVSTLTGDQGRPVSYQWIDASTGSAVAGATTSSYQVPNSLAPGTYTYYVSATVGGLGIRAVDTLRITVLAPPSISNRINPNKLDSTYFQGVPAPTLVSTLTGDQGRPVSYQWIDASTGSAVAGATTSSYQVPNSLAPGTYTYYVSATVGGLGIRAVDTLRITVLAPPSISNRINPNKLDSTYFQGVPAPTLVSTLTGDQGRPVSYQWIDASTGSAVAGATTSSYQVPNSLAPGTYTYYVSATVGGLGIRAVDTLRITVLAPPSISNRINPNKLDSTYFQGVPAPTLVSTLTGDQGRPVSYQWIDASTGSAVAGATTSSYQVPNSLAPGTYTYYVSATVGGLGIRAVDTLRITVLAPPSISNRINPNKLDSTYFQGVPAPTLVSTLTGDQGRPVSYQWIDASTGSAVAGATTSSYQVPNSLAPGTYTYYVSATVGGLGIRAVDTLRITVLAPPSISNRINPNKLDSTYFQGVPAPTLVSTLTGDQGRPVSYQWIDASTGSAVAGATTSSYQVPNSLAPGTYTYYVSATVGGLGIRAVDTLRITVLAPPSISNRINPNKLDSTYFQGVPAPTLVSTLTGDQGRPVSYQWIDASTGSAVAGATTSSYQVPNSLAPGTYTYYVSATVGGLGIRAVDTLRITVLAPPSISNRINPNKLDSTYFQGVPAPTLVSTLTGDQGRPVSYQWIDASTGSAVAGATTSSYQVPNSLAPGTYTYYVSATVGGLGIRAVDTLRITVLAPPSISNRINPNKLDSTYFQGVPAPTLVSTLTGDQGRPVSYQWIDASTGSAVAGATTSSYQVPNSLAPGTYTYYVSATVGGLGIRAVDTLRITVLAPPSISNRINPNKLDSTYFQGVPAPTLVSTLTGDQGRPVSYQWIDASTGSAVAGATTSSYQVPNSLAPGTYTYYVSATVGGLGIRAVDTLRITVLAPPSISNRINPNKLDSTYFQGVPAPTLVSTLTGDQGRPVSYQWIDASTGSAVAGATTSSYQVPNSLAPGTYTYYVSATVGGLGIRAVDTLRITVLAPPSISNRINPNKLDSTYFQGVPAPTLVSTLTGDQGRPVSYQWIDASTGSAVAGATTSSYQVPNSLAPGTYTYYVSATVGGLGIRAVDTLRITVLAPPSISNRINPNKLDSTYFQGVPAPTLVSTLTGDQGRPVSYQWIDASTGSAVAGATTSSYQVPNSLAPGTYTYYVSATVGGLGIRAVDTLRITVLAPPSISNRINPNKLDSTYFQGVPAPTLVSTLTGDQGRPVSYQWIDASTGSAVAGATTSSYQVPNSLAPGTYTYYVSATVGGLGIRAVDTLRITVLAPPSISNRINPNKLDSTYFQGVPAPTLVSTLTGDQGRPVSYQWIDASTGSAVAGATTSSYQVPNSLAPGTYTYYVSATVGGLGIRAVDTLRITVLAPPTVDIAITSGNAEYCAGTQNPTLTATVTGASNRTITYQWMRDNVTITGATNATYTLPANLTAGTYIYRVSATVVGLTIPSDSQAIVVYPAPNAQITTSSNSFCSGSISTATLSAPSQTYTTYQWLRGNQAITGATNATYTVPNSTTPGTYSYALRVTNSNGCIDTSNAVNVTVHVTPSVAATISGVNSDTTTLCTGYTIAPMLNSTVTASGTAVTYQWQVDNASINGATSSSFTLPTGLSAGTYTYRVIASTSAGCADTSNNLSVIVNSTPSSPTITANTSSDTVCFGTQVQMSIPATTGAMYQWRMNGQPINGATSTSYSQVSTTPVGQYSYSVVVTANDGCSAVSNPKIITVTPQPQVAIATTGPTTFFTGGSPTPTITSTVTPSNIAGLAYQWLVNNASVQGATNATYSVPSSLSAGTYNYRLAVRTPFGCVDTSDTLRIVVLPPAEVAISVTAGSAEYCFGSQPATLTAVVSGAGNNTVGYQWYVGGQVINGATNVTYTLPVNTIAGTYQYTVRATVGGVTTTSNTQTIVINPKPNATVAANPTSYCLGSGSTTTISAPNQTYATYQWLLNGQAITGATNATYTLPSTTTMGVYGYSLIVANAQGCLDTSASVNVTVNPKPIVAIQTTDTVYCSGSRDIPVLSVRATQGQSYASYQWLFNNQVINGATNATFTFPTNTGVGTYSISLRVTNINGCSDTSSAIVIRSVQAVNPVIAANPTRRTFCEGENTTITMSTSATTGAMYQWLVNGQAIAGATNNSFVTANNLAANTYNYTVRVSLGQCVGTSPVYAIVVSPTPDARIVATATTYCTGSSVTPVLSAPNQTYATYQWLLNGQAITGATNATYTLPTSLTTGNYSYSVRVTNQASCFDTSNVIAINVGNVEALAFVRAPGNPTSISICSTSTNRPTLATTVSGCGNTTATYQWRLNGGSISGATNSSYSVPRNVSVGTYQYSVAVSCGGCTDISNTVMVTVTSAPSPIVRLQTTNATSFTACRGAEGGVLVVTQPTSGISSYQWLLAGQPIVGQTNASFRIPTTNVGSYLYCVLITDACGQRVSNEFPVQIVNAPTPSITVANQGSCVGNVNITLRTQAINGGRYQWFVAGQAINGATTNSYRLATNTAAGTYAYTVRVSVNGCTGESTTQTVVVTPGVEALAFVRASGNPTSISICSTSTNRPTLATTVSGCGNTTATYQWRLNGGSISGATNSSYSVPRNVSVGTYQYSVAVSCGGCTDISNTVMVTVTSAPSPIVRLQTTNATSFTACRGAEGGVLVVTQPTSGISSYQWLLAGQPIVGQTNASFRIPTTNVGSYLYCVLITDACGQRVSNEFPVQIVNAPTPSITVANQGSCVGNVNITLRTQAINGGRYQWFVAGQAINGATTNSYRLATNTAAGTYAYTVRVSVNGCTGESTTQTVVVTPGVEALAFVRASGNPTSISICSTSTNRPTLATTVSGCGNTTATYQWRLNGGSISGATNSSYSVPRNVSVGTYQYSVAVSCGGCTDISNTVMVTVTSAPSPIVRLQTTNATSFTACRGAEGGVLVVTQPTSGISSYQWLLAGQPIVGQTNASFRIPTTNVGSYLYCVLITDACGQRVSNEFPVQITNPVAPMVNGDRMKYCVGSGNFATLTTSPVSGASYQWLLNGQPISGATASTYRTPSSLAVGSYAYTVRVSNGQCSGVSLPYVLMVDAVPTPTVTIVGAGSDVRTLTWCEGNPQTPRGIGQPTLQTQQFLVYQWSVNGRDISGGTNRSYMIPWSTLRAGTYVFRVRATNNDACEGTSNNAITVTVTPAPSVTASATFTSYCSGATVRPVIAANGGSFSSYQWFVNGQSINGATSATYPVPAGLAMGTYRYSVGVTNAQGCSDTSNIVNIGVTSGPVATIVGNTTICSGDAARITFTLTSGSTTNWSLTYREGNVERNIGNINGSTYTISVAPTATTTYTLVSVSAGGCVNTNMNQSVTVTVNSAPAAQAITSLDGNPTNACYGATKTFTVLNANPVNTYTWSIICSYQGVQTQQISPTQYRVTYPAVIAGNPEYCATVRVVERTPNGCERVTTLCTTVRPAPVQITPTVSSNTVCSGGSVNVQLANAQTGVTYRLFNGSTQIGDVKNGPGNLTWAVSPQTNSATYTVRALNQSGCEATMGQVTISVVSAPTVAVTTTSANLCPNTQGVVRFAFSGQGPWSLTYNTGSNQSTTVTTWQNPYVVTQNFTQSTTFTATAVSNATCRGSIVSGSSSATVTVVGIPSTSLVMGFNGNNVSANSANKVLSWTNFAGTGNASVSATNDVERPTLYPNYSALNGNGAIYFDGGDKPVQVPVSTGSQISGGTQKSWFMVYRPTSSTLSNNRMVIYKQGDANHGFAVYLINRVVYYGMWNNQLSSSNTNKWSVFQNTGFTVQPGSNYIMQMVYNGNASSANRLRFSLNGTVYTPSQQPGTSMDFSGDVASIGGVIGDVRFHDVASINEANEYRVNETKVADVLLYNTSDKTTRDQVWCVLRNKFGFNSLGDNPVGVLAKTLASDDDLQDDVANSGEEYTLSNPYPNPGMTFSNFTLSVSRQQLVKITVLNALGQEIAILHNGVIARGSSSGFTLDATNLPSGMYTIQVQGENFATSRQVVIVK